jgi:hypothetical protein
MADEKQEVQAVEAVDPEATGIDGYGATPLQQAYNMAAKQEGAETTEATETIETAETAETAETTDVAKQEAGESEAARNAREELERKDRELWQQKLELKQQQDRFKQLESFYNEFKQNPTQAMRQAGIDPYQLADSILTGEQQQKKEVPPEYQELKTEYQKMRDEIEQYKTQQWIAQQEGSINGYINQSHEQLPVLAVGSKKGNPVARNILDYVHSTYQRTGRTLSYDEAAMALEKVYSDSFMDHLTELIKSPTIKEKVSALLGQQSRPSNTPPITPPKQSQTTISQKAASEPPSRSVEPMTAEEARKAALEIMQNGNLYQE